MDRADETGKTIVLPGFAGAIKVPRPPNFVRLDESDGYIPIGNLSDENLRLLGAAMTERLLARAAEQRRGVG